MTENNKICKVHDSPMSIIQTEMMPGSPFNNSNCLSNAHVLSHRNI
jgi:hypothetical protein